MNRPNIISVSWGDHLMFGEGYGKLDSLEALRIRMDCWREELDSSIVLWRENRTGTRGHYFGEHRNKLASPIDVISWDDFEVVPQISHEQGFKTYLYVSLFDEGWPLPPKNVREVSFHNSMHQQHVSWQSRFSWKHPEYMMINRTGDVKQWGVLCLAYPEVRAHFCERYLRLLSGYNFDGLFVCLRSQSKPPDFADQFGFNEPIRQDYLKRYGRDILKEDFDLQNWRDLIGEYLTRFLSELRDALKGSDIRLAIGIPRGDVIGPPLGNWSLKWRKWVKDKIIDDLIINQYSSQCPSMWHQLWPMHRGYGYIQNYHDNYNMPDLEDDLDNSYYPIISNYRTNLFIARQWNHRNSNKEKELLNQPAVKGLVFSSFRFDNPEAIKRDDWTLYSE